MYARRISMQLKPDSGAKFTQTLENEIIPMLRNQSGFRDELTFLAPEGRAAFAISLWDSREAAEAYERETYPEVARILADLMDGTPRVQNYVVANSTPHRIAASPALPGTVLA